MPHPLRLLLLLILGLFGLQPVGYGYDVPGVFVSGIQNIVAASPETRTAQIFSHNQCAAGGSDAQNAAVDANKLNHIFGKTEHDLDGLVSHFGSQEKAFNAIQTATQAAVKAKNLQGVFEITVQVGSEIITVRGNVIDGVAKIGTAFKP